MSVYSIHSTETIQAHSITACTYKHNINLSLHYLNLSSVLTALLTLCSLLSEGAFSSEESTEVNGRTEAPGVRTVMVRMWG